MVRRSKNEAVFESTNTIRTPFQSMLKYLIARNQTKFVFIFGFVTGPPATCVLSDKKHVNDYVQYVNHGHQLCNSVEVQSTELWYL